MKVGAYTLKTFALNVSSLTLMFITLELTPVQLITRGRMVFLTAITARWSFRMEEGVITIYKLVFFTYADRKSVV